METPQATRGQRAARIVAVSVFIASLLGWLLGGWIIAIALDTTSDPEAGDALIGVTVVAFLLAPIAFVSSAIVLISCLACGRELSLGMKLLFIAPSFIAFLCGAAMLVRLFLHSSH